MNDGACCSHTKVAYMTTMVLGLTKGWWECTDCGQKFAPTDALQRIALNGGRSWQGDWCAKVANEILRAFKIAAEANAQKASAAPEISDELDDETAN